MRRDEHLHWVDIKINGLGPEDIVPIVIRDLPYRYWPARAKRRIQH